MRDMLKNEKHHIITHTRIQLAYSTSSLYGTFKYVISSKHNTRYTELMCVQCARHNTHSIRFKSVSRSIVTPQDTFLCTHTHLPHMYAKGFTPGKHQRQFHFRAVLLLYSEICVLYNRYYRDKDVVLLDEL